ncbi:hypothetical protein DNTS_012076, partial [Danionella cerebrum]
GLLSLCLLINASQTSSSIFTVPSTAPPSTPPHPQGALYLLQPPKAKAIAGRDVLLPCLMKNSAVSVDEGEVSWFQQSLNGRRVVLRGNETMEDRFAGRMFLSGDLSMGNLSVTLKNISLEDRGLYLCTFFSGNSTAIHGDGTKLSIRTEQDVMGESVGTAFGITMAVVGVAAGLVALILTQFKHKLKCLQK